VPLDISLTQAARLLNGEINGDQILCRGPGHSPKDRSLSVKLTSAARSGFVCHSFANDDPMVCRDYVAEKLGLPKFKPASKTISLDAITAAVMQAASEYKPKGKPVAVYPYTDADGTLLYEQCRFEPKRFAYRLPNGTWKGPDRRVIYRWPDLLKHPDATAFVCEGEKDADNVAALDLCATTVASGKWTDDCIQALKDRDCWIIQDCDEPGKKKALTLAAKLSGVAKSIKIVHLPGLTGVQDNKDVSDWLLADHTKDQLIDACTETPDWEPSGSAENKAEATERASEPIAKSKSLVAFPLVRFGDLSITTERDYLIKGVLPRVGLVLIWGPPKCGKSFWGMDTALHVALGWQYRNRKTQQASVVYLALEGHGGYARRIEAFKKYHNVKDAPFYLLRSKINLVRKVEQLIKDIEAQLGDERPGVIFVDTLNRSLSGSESSDEDMAKYLEAAGKIEEHFSCCVVVIHHCGLDATRPRGHTSLTAAVDVQIAIKRGGDLEVIATVEHAKDDKEGDEIFSRLHRVDIGFDADGDPINSLVALPSHKIFTGETLKLEGVRKLAYDALVDAIADAGEQPKTGRCPAKTPGTTLEIWTNYFVRRTSGRYRDPDNSRTTNGPDNRTNIWLSIRQPMLSGGHCCLRGKKERWRGTPLAALKSTNVRYFYSACSPMTAATLDRRSLKYVGFMVVLLSVSNGGPIRTAA
jgi:AAA domain